MTIVGVVVVGLLVCALPGAVGFASIVPRPLTDAPEPLALLCAAMLGSERPEWGRAMVGELAPLTGRSARRGFALGCVRATMSAPAGAGVPWRAIVAAYLFTATACAGLVGFALVRYPGLVTGPGTWVELAIFLAVLGVYVASTGVILRKMDGTTFAAVRPALLAGVGVTAAVVAAAIAFAAQAPQIALLTSWLVVPLGAVAVGAVGARRRNLARVGRQAALLAAFGAGLLVFLGWVADTVATADDHTIPASSATSTAAVRGIWLPTRSATTWVRR
jgi:hypothetical protein